VYFQQPPHSLLKSEDAGLEPLEQKDSNQAVQVGSCSVQAGVGLVFLFRDLYVTPQSIAGVGEFWRQRVERRLAWFPQIAKVISSAMTSQL
jgi:hypothetical protein